MARRDRSRRRFLAAAAGALALAACGAPGATQVPYTATPTATQAQPTPAPVATEVPGESAPTSEPSPASDSIEGDTAIRKWDKAPDMTIDTSKTYVATFRTEKGDIVVELFADRTPKTVNNFVFLARQGYYDGSTFHRVLEGFMAQGGDPTGTGTGGPGYVFGDEIVPSLTFNAAGLLAMANAGPGTNGSQFFLTFAPTPWLNGNHTIFGEVIEGMDVLLSLRLRDPQTATFQGDKLETVLIEER